ncbi:MAG: hypothetical protein JW785_05155 [Acidimicrobiia bacterium]|nr:hypothetical protein [Acidimicrobiia bacterium]
MWYHSDVALAVHRARLKAAVSRPRGRREQPAGPARHVAALRPAAVPWAR